MNEQALVDLSQFLHEVQKERGIVSQFLHRKDDTFFELLNQQSFIVDTCSRALIGLPHKQSAKIEPFLGTLNYLNSKRKYIVSHMMPADDANCFFTRDIITPCIDIIQELAVFETYNNPTRVTAYVNFLHWKERIGRQRAIGGELFDTDQEHFVEIKGRLDYIIAKQHAYERMFLTLCDEATRQAITQLTTHNDAFQKIEAFNGDLSRLSGTKWLETFNGREWFDLFTQKMDLLHQVGLGLLRDLSLANDPPETPPQPQQPTSLRSAISPTHIATLLSSHMQRITNLPLFTGLEPDTLDDILKFARIATYEKGAIVFMQGEQALRFYVILSGWVKIFKGNMDGQESILQILTTGDSILETTIFNNTLLPMGAQAIEDLCLLSIPASIIREKLRTHQSFAMNMLSTISDRSQSMINQFEQLTLKSVTQRVGRFLLKQSLQNTTTPTKFKLPFEKSLIAGYLGMKPETFSRTLQTLKDQGVDIERNEISLPDVFALCSYCDMDLAAQCDLHGTAACPNPDCI